MPGSPNDNLKKLYIHIIAKIALKFQRSSFPDSDSSVNIDNHTSEPIDIKNRNILK
jgi:hypothetical protein